jgi:hypothetical protein
MQIDDSDEQAENAKSSIRESPEMLSNVTVSRLLQPEKARSPIALQNAGIEMPEIIEQFSNAEFSMRDTFDSVSNLTIESIEQSAKQQRPTDSINAGIVTSSANPI